MSTAILSPRDFGFPPKFKEFREGQIEAIPWAVMSDKRFRAAAMPVGSGKSGFALAIAKHFRRTRIDTITKGLQQQYVNDFEAMGLVNIKGRSNYACDVADDCKLGGHLRCTSQKAGTCPYIQKYNEAQASSIVLTNYAYDLAVVNKGQGLGDFDAVILDEAHDAPKALSSYLDFHISESEIERFTLKSPRHCGEDLVQWVLWASAAYAVMSNHLVTTKNPHHRALEAERMESLMDRLTRLQTITDSNWVCEISEGTKYGRFWKFECVWPGQYREHLFQNIPNVFLMSGSYRPSNLGEIGIKRSECDYRSWPSTFPKNRAPFYHVKCVNVKFGWKKEDERKWLETIDKIIESRFRERKGIIHTVSYARQRFLLENSRFSKYFITNSNDPDSEAAEAVVAKFRAAAAPSILVSPSFGTGWDFPKSDCEWQILTNIPFPPMQSKVMLRRKTLNPAYQAAQAAKELSQALGRGMRSEIDRCENFIVDNRIGWFADLAKKFLPEDFAYNTVIEIPKPGPRWNER